jgi:hypothetical protein
MRLGTKQDEFLAHAGIKNGISPVSLGISIRCSSTLLGALYIKEWASPL